VLTVCPGPWHPYPPLPGGFAVTPPAGQPAIHPAEAPPKAEAAPVSPGPPATATPRPPPAAPAAVPAAAAQAAAPPAAPAPDGPLPPDRWLLRVKVMFKDLRSLLHAAFAAGSAALLIVAAGRRTGLLMAATLALGKELGQLAFGFGFDRIDLADLAFDTLGIAAAAWACAIAARRSAWFRRAAGLPPSNG
jgi:hypothetical protein